MRWRLAALTVALLGSCGEPGPLEDAPGRSPPPRADDHGVFAVGGIGIDRITVDQGTSIEVFAGGQYIEPQARPTTIISGRQANVRAFWAVSEDWEPREIEARLTVHLPDGEVQSASNTLLIKGPPNENWIEGAFSWFLPPEWMDADTSFDVTLYEVDDPGDEVEAPLPTPRLPREGTASFGVANAERELDLVIVPIDHTYDGGKDCEGAPEIDAGMVEDIRIRLVGRNPVERVNITVRDAIEYPDQANKFGLILDELSELREQDDAPPWVYYYGLIDLCDWGSDAGFSGQARVPDEITPELAWKRVAVGTVRVSYGGILGTLTHELGHTQGRRHPPCDGESAIDENYPNREAKIGAVGFDIERWVLHPADHHDYMSYCSPGWVGSYGWNMVLPVIETLTDWKSEGVSLPEDEFSLVGSIYPDGRENWWLVRGDATGSQPVEDSLLVTTGEGVDEWPARVRPHVLGDGLEVVVPLPEPVGSAVTAAELRGRCEAGACTTRQRKTSAP